ncbi:MAG: hypothetical protein EPO35_00865 [Acidobacteria bacterium]|nr:MAG: hypothetical protein EPO35_00865 [Acidobacteriota bacterium]
MTIKAAGTVSLALVVALGAGWVWGASRSAAVDRERRRVEERVHFETARANVLEGRLTLVGNDYAGAARLFGQATADLEELQRLLREVGQAELAGRIEIVVSHLGDARQAAAAENANAWSAADAALQALKGIRLPE